MSFYGNITNVANTTFQFDKIYSNRHEMEASQSSDGVQIGRYVLVEYDREAAYPIIYYNRGKFYTSPEYEEMTRIKFLSDDETETDGFRKDDIGQVQAETVTFYQCIGETDDHYAVFEEIEKPSTNNYIANFSIDEKYYAVKDKSFSGYDSTVWVKVSEEQNNIIVTKYVNIANLNSVVPTFDITADAPTQEPIVPHFDASSTNVYYNLHVQTPFGFRIKAAEDETLSDEETVQYQTVYGVDTNETFIDKTKVNADIFYNKKGLDFKKGDTSNRVEDAPENNENYIKFVPSGKSSNYKKKYSHYPQGDEESSGDIQELSVHLPSVGYMVSKGWDIIHGEDRDDYRGDIKIDDDSGKEVRRDSLQGRLDALYELEKNQIPIKRTDKGVIVGTTINGGNQKNVENILEEKLTTSFDTDDAWIRTEINSDKVVGDETSGNCISIHHTYYPIGNTETKADKNTNNNDNEQNTGINAGMNDTIKLYSNTIDQAGHVVGTNVETVTLPYGYKTIETKGLSDIDDNDLIEDGFNGEAVCSALNTQDILTINPINKWIQIKIHNNNSINFSHEIHNIDIVPNGEENFYEKDSFNIPDWDYDNAGHITAKKNHSYILPSSFNAIKVLKISEEEEDLWGGSLISEDDLIDTKEAKKLRDELKIHPANKWIQFGYSESDDAIKIAHACPGVGQKIYKSQLKDDVSKIVKDIAVDKAGHIDTVEVSDMGDLKFYDFTENETSPFDGTLKSLGKWLEGGTFSSIEEYETTIESLKEPVTGPTTEEDEETGETVAVAGTSGLVPAPEIGDENKLLFGNGKWQDLGNCKIVCNSGTPLEMNYMQNLIDVFYGYEKYAVPYVEFLEAFFETYDIVEEQQTTIADLQSTIEKLKNRISTLEGYHSKVEIETPESTEEPGTD